RLFRLGDGEAAEPAAGEAATTPEDRRRE
ncbi:MAG: hypothetical protein HW394_2057, partial [Acidobacteria bacterium]|nr:hypothetical protein [Acidobacteriota bacterium]